MKFGVRKFDLLEPDRTIVIAEIGVNHNGSPDLAEKLVLAAVDADVDIVKFQAFISEKEISQYAEKAEYQKETTSEDGSQLEMCKALEMGGPALKRMLQLCNELEVGFLCAAFDFESVDLLTEDMKVTSIKIASSEVTNIPFLEYVGSKRVEVVLSTGASTLSEVGKAVETLHKSGCPGLMLLHCVSCYPAPCEQVNLRSMITLKDAFGLPVGFSDHTLGHHVAIAAAALGASAIEKHFTLDRTMHGPDHRSSVEPAEMKQMVAGVRTAGMALGSPVKRPASCEMSNLALIRKSIVAATDLKKGIRLTRDMLELKRPLGGIEPVELPHILGLTLRRDVGKDMHIRWDDLR